MKFEFHKTFTIHIPAGISATTPSQTAKPSPKPPSTTTRILVGVFGLLLLYFNLVQFRSEYLLKRDGVPGRGRVIKTYWSSGKGSPRYRVWYSYEPVAGNNLKGRGRIGRESYLTLKPGDPIAIFYVPAHPEIS